jgi:hypothetical protein
MHMYLKLNVSVNVRQWINMVRTIEYHFVSLHELLECALENIVEIWIPRKHTQTLYNYLFILCFPIPIKKITLQ